MTDPSARSLRRRFLLLTALRWFPGGLVLPVLVLLLQARGLDLSYIGTLFALFCVAVAILELPTGGLADAVGRRQVLVLSSLLSSLAFVMFALAQGHGTFLAAFMLFAMGRALSSGPLQAWYVDAVQSVDPAADLRPGLAKEGLVSSVALGSGAVIGGALPALAARVWPDLPASGNTLVISLTVPVWLAAGLLLVATVMLALLMTSPPRSIPEPDVRAVLIDVPRAIRSGLSVARRDPGARAVLLSVAAVGLAISATELIAPAYFADLIDDPARATALYGALVSAVFVASGLGSAVAPIVARLGRGSMRGAAIASVAGALSYAVLGASTGIVVAAVAYIAVYAALGAADPLRTEQLHHRVTSGERATMLSVESMAGMLGGVLGSLAVPRLVDLFGFAAGWFFCAAALLAAALLTAAIRDRRPQMAPQTQAIPHPAHRL